MSASTSLTRDGRGNYRRDLGWEAHRENKYRQHRFYLGQDEAVAIQRNDRLQQVWAAAEAMSRRWRYKGCPPRPIWDDATLSLAMAVARGETKVAIDAPPWLPEYQSSVDRYREVEPGVWMELAPGGGPRRIAQDRMDTTIARYYAELRTRLLFLVIAANDPKPEIRARERMRRDVTALFGAGERSRSQSEQSLGLELGLALGRPVRDLQFTDDGIRLEWEEGGWSTIPWAVIGGLAARVHEVGGSVKE
jgi:hypothetical protein